MPDLDRDRAREVLSRFVLQSDSSFAASSTAPDRDHPTTYVIAAQESDNASSVAAQEAMSANADYVVRLPAAHMVQLSRPDELAEAHKGETMTTAAMVTYAYDQIDRAQHNLTQARNHRMRRPSAL